MKDREHEHKHEHEHEHEESEMGMVFGREQLGPAIGCRFPSARPSLVWGWSRDRLSPTAFSILVLTGLRLVYSGDR